MTELGFIRKIKELNVILDQVLEEGLSSTSMNPRLAGKMMTMETIYNEIISAIVDKYKTERVSPTILFSNEITYNLDNIISLLEDQEQFKGGL